MLQESSYTDPMLVTQHIKTWRNELPSCHSAITDSTVLLKGRNSYLQRVVFIFHERKMKQVERQRKKEIVAKCQDPVIGCTTATVQMYHE